ncbi:MAG TPA: class I SAM-dependent rRNA methyltransferase [Gemmatimonadales bacterium]|nr:class I SAM-dependent rRNA methyltransferase [Gemmatimonadales bacterium]
MSEATVAVTAKGAGRWRAGHPWIYRSDVADEPGDRAGVVRVTDRKGKYQGRALYSPESEIRLRLLTTEDVPIDRAWWRSRIAAASTARTGIDASAWRVVHGEGDGLPSLVVDRYGPYAVAQLLSAGVEAVREDIGAAIQDVLQTEGVLLRNDAAVRRHEGLPLEVTLWSGSVPETVEVTEAGVRYLAAPWQGQKTGGFLDQRENRILLAAHAKPGGTAADFFAYHGSFTIHLAKVAGSVLAVDSSTEALARGAKNAALNGYGNVTWKEANVFDLLRELEARGEEFDTIALDPPAFAKTKTSVDRALAGYKEINLRAMRCLAEGGVLFTCSCSYHVHRRDFEAMLMAAAQDSGRRLEVLRFTGQSSDHPEILTIPETGYLKGALLRAV